MSERIFDKDSHDCIWLSETPDGLELTADAGDAEVTVTLSVRGARNLRLALVRYEKQHAHRAEDDGACPGT